jgi:hypothetical protein
MLRGLVTLPVTRYGPDEKLAAHRAGQNEATLERTGKAGSAPAIVGRLMTVAVPDRKRWRAEAARDLGLASSPPETSTPPAAKPLSTSPAAGLQRHAVSGRPTGSRG